MIKIIGFIAFLIVGVWCAVNFCVAFEDIAPEWVITILRVVGYVHVSASAYAMLKLIFKE